MSDVFDELVKYAKTYLELDDARIKLKGRLYMDRGEAAKQVDVDDVVGLKKLKF